MRQYALSQTQKFVIWVAQTAGEHVSERRAGLREAYARIPKIGIASLAIQGIEIGKERQAAWDRLYPDTGSHSKTKTHAGSRGTKAEPARRTNYLGPVPKHEADANHARTAQEREQANRDRQDGPVAYAAPLEHGAPGPDPAPITQIQWSWSQGWPTESQTTTDQPLPPPGAADTKAAGRAKPPLSDAASQPRGPETGPANQQRRPEAGPANNTAQEPTRVLATPPQRPGRTTQLPPQKHHHPGATHAADGTPDNRVGNRSQPLPFAPPASSARPLAVPGQDPNQTTAPPAPDAEVARAQRDHSAATEPKAVERESGQATPKRGEPPAIAGPSR